MKIKYPKRITILSHSFDMVYDRKTDGGWFRFSSHKMGIGIKSVKANPEYTVSIISHEVMECILALMGGRYEDARQEYVYKFNFDHQAFETAIQIHTEIMLQFIG